MELISFNNFINEGAHVKKDGKVYLQYADDISNPDETLKSSDGGRSWFLETPISKRSDAAPQKWSWPIFWGMGVNGIQAPQDHPGRIKYTMDQLKSGNIDDLEKSLGNFIKSSFNKLGITKYFRPDYVVTVGSTGRLVNAMADAITSAIGGDIKIIDLPKVIYFDAYAAFDWDEVNRQVEKNGEKTFNKVKTEIYNHVDKENTDDELKKNIREAQTIKELEHALSRFGVVWKNWRVGDREHTNFIVRSSAISSGGSRSMWQSKYDYEELAFINAVIDCAVNGKRMLIIDDNRHSGQDMQTIRANIRHIVSKLDRVQDSPENRFGFYVLYKIPHDKLYLDNRGVEHKADLGTGAVADFIEFIRNNK
jgi:hypothetical protein